MTLRKDAPIFVAGHRGLAGSALVRALSAAGFSNLITRTRAELDLLDTQAVADFFATEKPTYVILAAAKVGGIYANNTYPADFIYQNLQIQNNVIHQAHVYNVEKLLFLGSSCIYPKLAPQPIKEEYLLTGPLEPTNDAYAVAKIAGIMMCQSYRRQYGRNFISVMPTNLYGPGDNFDLTTAHVLPALIRRFHEGKTTGATTVTLWGTGSPRREFIHVDDMASACVHLLQHYNDARHINIGTGTDVTIKDLASMIADVVGYTGEILWDTSKPDGTPRKLLDVSALHAQGWQHQIVLRTGIERTYAWYCENHSS
jgi:GDP-L-fucose synthase